MTYKIPTEEIEKIRKSNNGIIMIDYQKNVIFVYNDINTIYKPNSMQLYVKWLFRKNDKTLAIESFYGEHNVRENFTLLLQILKSITMLKDGKRLGGNIIAPSLKKILPQVGFILEGKNKYYLYKDKF